MLTFETRGSLAKTEKFLSRMSKDDIRQTVERYAQLGVDALSSATPVDTGLTAASWGYKIESARGNISIVWTNSNTAGGKPVAILLQYGHGTGTGGFVQGVDYINPALKPVFDKIATNVWKAVTTA